jgi:hypothetical protein
LNAIERVATTVISSHRNILSSARWNRRKNRIG